MKRENDVKTEERECLKELHQLLDEGLDSFQDGSARPAEEAFAEIDAELMPLEF